VLAGVRGEGVSSASAHAAHLGHVGHQPMAANEALLPTLAAVGLHSLAMLAVAGVLAVVVYQKVGVEVLRRAWVNLDFIWVGTLIVVGSIALGAGFWPLLTG
jgi:cation transporter-like permease